MPCQRPLAQELHADGRAALTVCSGRALVSFRAAYAAGKSQDELRLQEQLPTQILSVCLGEPPLTFDFECKLAKTAQVDMLKSSPPVELARLGQEGRREGRGRRSDSSRLGTPLEFAERYCGVNLVALPSLLLFQARNNFYGKVYHPILIDGLFWAALALSFLNVEPEVLEAATIASFEGWQPHLHGL